MIKAKRGEVENCNRIKEIIWRVAGGENDVRDTRKECFVELYIYKGVR